ncbi:MAG: hypothetical protein IPK53_12415 [bacterium]|nr:hypothetical protein [bacterium]
MRGCPSAATAGKKTTIINFKGNIQQGDLILRGECLRCGGVVVRLLEGG